jgi:hypothetical protein
MPLINFRDHSPTTYCGLEVVTENSGDGAGKLLRKIMSLKILGNGIGECGKNRIIDNGSLIFENKINSEWLSTREAALVLSLTENALRIMVYRNQIRVFKLGRRLRFRLNDCLALFKMKGA